MPLPAILTHSDQIADFSRELKGCSEIAVDLEADSLHNYQEKVCLLQVSTLKQTVLIDPLGGADLMPLKEILADPTVRKIFHAADYDIRSLARDFDIELKGLFDTMISCQFLGEERFGLADVVKKFFGIELDKRFQRADWSLRPLPVEMIHYAAEDTRYLHRLAALVKSRLVEKGRLSWVEEEFRLLEKVRFAPSEGQELFRFKGAGILNRRQLGVLDQLLRWRDSEARRRNIPLFKVLGNKVLLDLARQWPKTRTQLSLIQGLPPRQIDRYGNALLAAVQTALELDESSLPSYPRKEKREKDPAMEQRLKRLKDWRTRKALELELDAGVLINNGMLEELARRQPRTIVDLEQIPALKNWQKKELGEDLLSQFN